MKLLKGAEKIKLLSTSIRINELIKGKDKEDLWILSNNSLVNVKYHIEEERTEKLNFRKDIKPFSITETVKPDPPKIFKMINFDIQTKRKTSNNVKDEGICIPLKTEGNLSHRERINCKVMITEPNKAFNTSVSLQNASTTVIPNNSSVKIDYEEVILEDNELFEQESFADMFFIAGLPRKNAKVLTESKYSSAPCKHTDCSILHAYRPTVLHRFPTEDYKGLKLSNSVRIFIFNV
jgi:hypothetical protein